MLIAALLCALFNVETPSGVEFAPAQLPALRIARFTDCVCVNSILLNGNQTKIIRNHKVSRTFVSAASGLAGEIIQRCQLALRGEEPLHPPAV